MVRASGTLPTSATCRGGSAASREPDPRGSTRRPSGRAGRRRPSRGSGRSGRTRRIRAPPSRGPPSTGRRTRPPAAAAYVATAVVLFSTSAIYHRGNWSPRVDQWLKRLDHANIFLLIAGTYTPFAVLALHGDTRVAVLATVWSLAILGALFRVLWVEAPRWLYTPMYIGLGWAAAFVVTRLLHGEGVTASILMSVG